MNIGPVRIVVFRRKSSFWALLDTIESKILKYGESFDTFVSDNCDRILGGFIAGALVLVVLL